MLTKINIRQALSTDFEPIDRFDIFAGDRQAEIERQECYVAVEENIITGYVTCDRTFYCHPFMRYLCVDFEYRRKGIGDRMMAFVEAKFQGDRLFSSTESDNLPMLNLFNKRGSKISGIIENLFQAKPEIVYCKDLFEQDS